MTGMHLRNVSGHFVIVGTSCTYTNLNGTDYYTSRLCGIAIVSGLEACTACFCRKQRKISSNTEENDVIKICSKCEMYEAAVGITWHTVL